MDGDELLARQFRSILAWTNQHFLGMAALVALWFVAHIPAFSDTLQNCGDCSANAARCLQTANDPRRNVFGGEFMRQPELDAWALGRRRGCEEEPNFCNSCKAHAWRAFFP